MARRLTKLSATSRLLVAAVLMLLACSFILALYPLSEQDCTHVLYGEEMKVGTRIIFWIYENDFRSNINSSETIRPQICTCHDSWAVVACAILWHDLIIIFHAKATHVSARFESWACKCFAKWVPEHWMGRKMSAAIFSTSVNLSVSIVYKAWINNYFLIKLGCNYSSIPLVQWQFR